MNKTSVDGKNSQGFTDPEMGRTTNIVADCSLFKHTPCRPPRDVGWGLKNRLFPLQSTNLQWLAPLTFPPRFGAEAALAAPLVYET
jgi:hypothetical protein